MTTCDKPTISDGSASPADASIDYEETYEVTCDTGFTISTSSSTMTCGTDGVFDQTPTCEGKCERACARVCKSIFCQSVSLSICQNYSNI